MSDPIDHSMTQEEGRRLFEFMEKHDLFDPIPGGDLTYTKKKDDDNDDGEPANRGAEPPQHRAVPD